MMHGQKKHWFSLFVYLTPAAQTYSDESFNLYWERMRKEEVGT